MKYVALIFCLMAGMAHADGFYVEGGLSMMEKLGLPAFTNYSFGVDDHGTVTPVTVTSARFRRYDINDTHNPYGALSFGYDWRWRAVMLDLQLQHQSSIEVGDHGQNTLRLNLRWYPFQ